MDGAIIVLCGVGGVEPQTEKVWYQASKYKIPRIAYINKLDRIGSDYNDVVNQIEDKFGVKTLLLQIPFGEEENFKGIIDLVEMKVFRYDSDFLGANYEIVDIPEEYIEEAELHRDNLIETLADFDLNVMELFLEKEPVPKEIIKRAVRSVTLQLQGVPVAIGSSFKNKAVQNLLDAIIDYLPSPLDKEDAEGYSPKSNKRITRKLSDDEPFSALVFKILSDPYVGQLIYLRVYSGSIKTGGMVYNSNKQKRVRVSRLLKMHSNKREEVQELFSGDIAATVGISEISTGDTLCDERNQIVLNTITFPEPVIKATVEPKLTSDHDKLDTILAKLSMEDPTFKTHIDSNTGQKIISGMGELHLEVIQERIKREFGVAIKIGKPRVAYHETIRGKAIGVGEYIQQIAGKNQYAKVSLEVAPSRGDETDIFKNKLKAGLIPKEYIDSIEEGVTDAMNIGEIAGFPVSNVRVNLVDGVYSDEDSTEVAFKIAASLAFKNAFKKGNPILLEPVMKIEILVQDEYLGEVMGDFSSREGKITKMDNRNGLHILDGLVPLSNMFGYATALRTLSQGRANYSMEFYNYAEMTETKMKDVLKHQLGIYTIN